MVFYKPDALVGEHALLVGQRASAMLVALAWHCRGGTDVIDARVREAAEDAHKQVLERARMEPSFAETLLNSSLCAARLENSATELCGAVSVPLVVAGDLALVGLGFNVRCRARLTVSTRDVDEIYSRHTGAS